MQRTKDTSDHGSWKSSVWMKTPKLMNSGAIETTYICMLNKECDNQRKPRGKRKSWKQQPGKSHILCSGTNFYLFCVPGCSWTRYVPEGALLFHLPAAKITGTHHHTWLKGMLGSEPRAECMLGKFSTHWATPPAPHSTLSRLTSNS